MLCFVNVKGDLPFSELKQEECMGGSEGRWGELGGGGRKLQLGCKLKFLEDSKSVFAFKVILSTKLRIMDV